jgi:CRP/FNR family transcriptional regulator
MPGSLSSISLVERLADLPYFRALSADRLDYLASHALLRTFAAGEMILVQDTPSAGLWLVDRGQVKISRLSPDGREHILMFIGPGGSFNDIPALDGGSNPATATALIEMAAWVLPAPVIMAELRANPILALDVIGILAQRTRQLVQQIEDLALCSVTTRLARFLLKQTAGDPSTPPDVTRTTLAAHLATTPETISRALRTLETIGAIEFDRQTIVIVRDDLLHTVAQG